MKKIIILITICSILFTLCACTERKNVVQTETYTSGQIDSINNVTNENSTTPTDTKYENTEETTPETTVPENVENKIKVDDIENVGKELVVYGDVNQEAIKNIEKYLGSYNNNISLGVSLSDIAIHEEVVNNEKINYFYKEKQSPKSTAE